MAMIPAKCTNCGANIQVDESKEAGICEACGTPFITEKVINNYNTTNNYHIETVNVFTSAKDFQVVAGKLVKYKGESSTIVIPSNVKIIGEGAFGDCELIDSIYIPQNVKRIESGWLSDDIEEILIKVDSLEHWCNVDFNRYIETYSIILEVNGEKIADKLIIPNGVKVIESYTFSYCESLTEVVFPSSVEHIEVGAFANCSKLKKVVLPESLASIANKAFESCYELESVTFNNGLKSIGEYAFAWCKKLKNVALPDSVEIVGRSCFGHCESLETVKLSSSIEVIQFHTFSECGCLKQIDIPMRVKSIESNAFEKCYALSTVNIQNPNIHIWNDAFVHTLYANKASSGGCYIATCVYGSYDCPQVWTLRRYRDDTLGATWYGRLFIRVYYAISPTLVKWFGKTTWFKRMWQGRLDKMVSKLNNDGVKNTPYQDKEW